MKLSRKTRFSNTVVLQHFLPQWSNCWANGCQSSKHRQSHRLSIQSPLIRGLGLLIAGLVFFNPVIAETPPDDQAFPQTDLIHNDDRPTRIPEPDLDQISAGTLFLSNNNQFLDAPALESSVQMSISGIVASVTLKQSFTNHGSEWVEGLYAFPLPDNAAINGLTIQVGERTIEGEVQEKSVAKKTYKTASDQGKVASLVRQHRANLFSSRIANIGPGKKVQISLRYVQTIQPRDEQFSLRFPMTLTPRYSNRTVTDARDISPPQVHLHDVQHLSDNAASMRVGVTLHAATPVKDLASPSHQLLMQHHDDRVEVQSVGPVPMDQDFLLNWQFEDSNQPSITTWHETVGERDYLLAMVRPPESESRTEAVPRELILVIDTSGSMAGESLRAAREALNVAIDGLRIGDRFNIIAFDSTTRKLYPAPVDVTEETLAIARSFTNRLNADGGTEMEPALRAAFANPNHQFLRQVVFITDGSVGNETHLFSLIEQSLRDSRLFTVGIGPAPNAWFMKKAAAAGRGTFTFVSHADDAQQKMSQLFRKLERPALTGLSINWLGGTADYTPSPIPDVYIGEPLIIAAQLNPGTNGLHIHGMLAQDGWEQTLNFEQTPLVGSGISTVWARNKIESLLEKQRRSNVEDLYQDTITHLAIEHRIASPYTSFVAVDQTPARPTGEPVSKKAIPNLMPAGSTMQSINYPQGSAGSDTWLLICVLALSLLTIIKTGCFKRDSDYASYR